MRDIMRHYAPEGFEQRRPGAKRKAIVRVGLTSLGPFCELSADGHEKLNAQALQMGDLSLNFYAYRDKWPGVVVEAKVLRDTRNAASMGFAYIDLIRKTGGESA